jgi:hypothetical protein
LVERMRQPQQVPTTLERFRVHADLISQSFS